MRHFMKGGSGKKPHLFRRQIQYSGPVQGWIQKHGERAEDDHGGNGHSGFVRFAFDDGFRPQNGCCPANGTADGGQQGRVPVHFQQAPQPGSQKNGESDHNKVERQGGAADVDDTLKSQFESVQDNACSQNLLGAELNAGNPCFRKVVAQAVGVKHSQHNADDQRAEGKMFHPFKIRNVKSGKGKQNNKQDAVEGIG